MAKELSNLWKFRTDQLQSFDFLVHSLPKWLGFSFRNLQDLGAFVKSSLEILLMSIDIASRVTPYVVRSAPHMGIEKAPHMGSSEVILQHFPTVILRHV